MEPAVEGGRERFGIDRAGQRPAPDRDVAAGEVAGEILQCHLERGERRTARERMPLRKVPEEADRGLAQRGERLRQAAPALERTEVVDDGIAPQPLVQRGGAVVQRSEPGGEVAGAAVLEKGGGGRERPARVRHAVVHAGHQPAIGGDRVVDAEVVGDGQRDQDAAEDRLQRDGDRIGHVGRADLDEADGREGDEGQPEGVGEIGLGPAAGERVLRLQPAEIDEGETGHQAADPQPDHHRDHQRRRRSASDGRDPGGRAARGAARTTRTSDRPSRRTGCGRSCRARSGTRRAARPRSEGPRRARSAQAPPQGCWRAGEARQRECAIYVLKSRIEDQ